jgi:peptidoglycan hydrolase CwlO-like protein
MGKGGKHLQNTSQEIKELQEYNHELHNQIDMKDKLIETLEWKLIQRQNIIDHMVDTIQSTNDLIQNIDASCDTEDLIEKIDATCDT